MSMKDYERTLKLTELGRFKLKGDSNGEAHPDCAFIKKSLLSMLSVYDSIILFGLPLFYFTWWVLKNTEQILMGLEI